MQQPPPTQQGFSPSPSGPVSFDALSQAIKVLQTDIGYWAILSLILIVVVVAIGAIGMFLMAAIGLGSIAATRGAVISLPMMMLGNMVVLILVIALAYALFAGYLDVCVRRMAGEKTTINDLFSGMGKVSQLFVAGVLVGLCIGIGNIFFVIPGLYFAAAFSLTPLMVLRQGLAPVDAMKKSMEAINRGGVIMMILLIIVANVCAGLGGIACGIGAIFTMAISPLTIACVYKGLYPAD
jgi:uncharacterized membrane protein